jgi:hypothetical protein
VAVKAGLSSIKQFAKALKTLKVQVEAEESRPGLF